MVPEEGSPHHIRRWEREEKWQEERMVLRAWFWTARTVPRVRSLDEPVLVVEGVGEGERSAHAIVGKTHETR